MQLETPQMINTAYQSSNYALGMNNFQGLGIGTNLNDFQTQLNKRLAEPITTKPEENDMAQQKRIVQVFVCDPNENVPLEKALLYKGDQKLTDATDQELYFEIPLQQILSDYNKERVKYSDKELSKKSGKDIFLEPVKIRDLKMVICNVAQF
jgi:hypothetical protein